MTEKPISPLFAFPPADKSKLEGGARLTPKFGADGLVTCVATDAGTGEVLMLAHMNAEALARSIETGIAHYWSRSRQELWRKGDTSGTRQTITEMRIDCDQDAVWIKVRVAGSGASCHTGRTSCFYRSVPVGSGTRQQPLDGLRLSLEDFET